MATGDEEDDEGAWEGWDVESDSSEESADGWISVDSDSDDLEVSDSEDEGDKANKYSFLYLFKRMGMINRDMWRFYLIGSVAAIREYLSSC